MHYLRILHNGDLRKDSPKPSPHWTVLVHEDGRIVGEVLMREWSRWSLPKDFQIPEHSRFFDIPPELTAQDHLTTSPHFEDLIVSLMRGDGRRNCTFLMSQLPEGCRLHSALADLLQKIGEIVEAVPVEKRRRRSLTSREAV